jgi:hypothetical protein
MTTGFVKMEEGGEAPEAASAASEPVSAVANFPGSHGSPVKPFYPAITFEDMSQVDRDQNMTRLLTLCLSVSGGSILHAWLYEQMYPNGAASDSAATTMTRFANPVFADDKWKCDEAEVAESFATYGAMVKKHPAIKVIDYSLARVLQASVAGNIAIEAFVQVATPTYSQLIYALHLKIRQEAVQVNIALLHRMANAVHGIGSEDYAQEVTELLRALTVANLGLTELMTYIYVIRLQSHNEMTASRARDCLRAHAVKPDPTFSLLNFIQRFPDDSPSTNHHSINSTAIVKHGGARVGEKAAPCKRCLHVGHTANKCYAVISKNGTRLTSPGQPVPAEVAERRRRQNENRRATVNTATPALATVPFPTASPALPVVPANVVQTAPLLPHQQSMRAQADLAYTNFQQALANINSVEVVVGIVDESEGQAHDMSPIPQAATSDPIITAGGFSHVDVADAYVKSSLTPLIASNNMHKDISEALGTSILPSLIQSIPVDVSPISFGASIKPSGNSYKSTAPIILDTGAGIDFTAPHSEIASSAHVTDRNQTVVVQGIGGQQSRTAGVGTWKFQVLDVDGQPQVVTRTSAQMRSSPSSGVKSSDTRVISVGAMVKYEKCKLVLDYPHNMYLETSQGTRMALEINEQNIVVFVTDGGESVSLVPGSSVTPVHFIEPFSSPVSSDDMTQILQVSPMADVIFTARQTEVAYEKVTRIMHLRCAHQSLPGMRRTLAMRDGDTVNGVKIQPQHLINMICNSCKISKARNAPLRKKSTTPTRLATPLYSFDTLPVLEPVPPFTSIDLSEENVLNLLKQPNLAKPGQVVSLDPKTFRVKVVGNHKAMLHAVDVHTHRLYGCIYDNQKQYGEAFTRLIVAWQLHRKPYPVTIVFDGSGGNKMLEQICAHFGLNFHYTPPYQQSLNPVEPTIKLLYDAANATMIDNAGLIPMKYFAHVLLSTIELFNMRSSTASCDYVIPLQAWDSTYTVNVQHLRNIGDVLASRKTTGQRTSELDRLARTFTLDADGNIVNALTHNPNPRGETTICLGHPSAYALKTVTLLRLNNRGTFSTSTSRSQQPTNMTAADHTTDPTVDNIVDASVPHTLTGPDLVLPQPPEVVIAQPNVHGSSLSDFGRSPLSADDDPAASPASVADTSFASDSTHVPDDGEELTDAEIEIDDTDISMDFYDYNTASTVKSIMSAQLVPRLYDYLCKSNTDSDIDVDTLTSHEAKQLELVHKIYTEQGDPDALIMYGAPKLMKPTMDVSWHKIVDSSEHQEYVAALQKEMSRLDKYGFYVIPTNDPHYDALLRHSNQGRLIASRKRNGTPKVRCVEQGDRSAILYNVNSYAPVATLDQLRHLFLRPPLPRTSKHNIVDSGEHIYAMMDNESAYLQATPLALENQYCVRVYNPLTKQVFLMRCPTYLYGSLPGAASWFKSAIAQARKDGWRQGFQPRSPASTLSQDHSNALSMSAANAPCILYHPDTNTVKAIYVDDCLYAGYRKLVEKHFCDWRKRFDTTALQILTESSPMDFIGICLSISNGMKYMDMQYYITKIATVFKVYDYPKQRLPMPFPITDLRPLDPDEAAEFRALVGANGWVVLSVMLTSKAAQSCIAAFLSKPVAGAFLQARQMAAYHFQNRHLGLGAPLIEPNPVEPLYSFYSDSNNGEPEDDYKCRRAFVGGINFSSEALALTGNRANAFVPLTAYSKTSGIANASPLLDGSHPGTGSGEHETYALGEAATYALQFSYCVEESGTMYEYPIWIYTDATTARVFANGTKGTTRMRQIDMRQAWIQRLRDTRVITVKYVPSKMTADGKCNLSDCLSKLFGKHPLVFERQRALLQVEVDEHSLFNTAELSADADKSIV